jgi:indole-3-pyruvate monooxygenase
VPSHWAANTSRYADSFSFFKVHLRVIVRANAPLSHPLSPTLNTLSLTLTHSYTVHPSSQTSGQLTIDGREHLVLERAEAAGDSWTHHYKRLCLHSHRAVSHLPGVPFPQHWPAFVPREQVVDYLRGYVTTMHLPVYFGHEVASCEPVSELRPAHEAGSEENHGHPVKNANPRWLVRTRELATGEERRVRCRNLVVCVGENATPHRPTIAGLDRFPGTVLHSHEYDEGSAFAGQRVLVVGFGNSGGEILIDLCEHDARPDVVVRSPCNIFPRDMFLPFM